MAEYNAAQAQGSHGGNVDPLEKDFSNNNGGYPQNGNAYHMNDMNMDNDTALSKIRTAGSISISPELFEKIYLSPQNAVKGDLRKTFGNPTPMYDFPFRPLLINMADLCISALVGFLICLSPLSADLMGWRGAGGNGAASM
jgi:hypothetical protein